MGIGSIVKACLPDGIRSGLRPAYRALQSLGWTLFCPVCEKKVPCFSVLSSFYSEQLEKHGSDIRLEDAETCNYKGYACPNCGAADRDRLYALYLGRRLGASVQENFGLLDIAPATALSKHLRRRYRIRYRTADLQMQDVDDRVDITRMDCYPDATFDAFICSHVLEHIPDDQAAMRELFRILKPGGWGIAMVPISLALREIREDPSKTTEAERWANFGQSDHVRLYNRAGFLERLGRAGFKTFEFGVEFFGTATFARCGIADQSVLYVVEK